MNVEAAQMVPASGWTGGRVLGVDRVYQVVAGEVLQPLPKESRFGFVDDDLWRARGLRGKIRDIFSLKARWRPSARVFCAYDEPGYAKHAECHEANL